MKPKLILTIAPSGAGKTEYSKRLANELPNTIICSSDAIREKLYGSEMILGDNNEVFALMHKRTICALKEGKNVIYDATSLTRKSRGTIIAKCPKYVEIEAHVVWNPIEVCIERDAMRERTVGKDVIDKQLKRFQAPYYDEGIDNVKIILPEEWIEHPMKDREYLFNCLSAMEIPHDNEHHTLGIKEHADAAFNYMRNMTDNDDMQHAALLHDIGKFYTKSFVSKKGNITDQAHYFGHAAVGSWMSYGLPNITPFTAWFISTHMDVFHGTKYYKNLPPFLKDCADQLHEADLAAH